MRAWGHLCVVSDLRQVRAVSMLSGRASGATPTSTVFTPALLQAPDVNAIEKGAAAALPDTNETALQLARGAGYEEVGRRLEGIVAAETRPAMVRLHNLAEGHLNATLVGDRSSPSAGLAVCPRRYKQQDDV